MHPKSHLRTLASMATSHRQPPPPPPLDLEVTIVSAKHLKNVNWRTGDLKPYVVFWLDPDFKRSTKPDDSGSTRPVWNERFTLPLSLLLHDSSLSLDVFHSKPSETPKPLVGSLRISLSDLPDPDDDSRIRTFYLTRPSGRPQGKIRLKLSVKERQLPDYSFAPQHPYYYVPATATAPVMPQPPPPPRDYRHAPPPPPPAREYRHIPPSPAPPPPPPPPRDYGHAPPIPASVPAPTPPSRPSCDYQYMYPPPPPAPEARAYGSHHETYSAPAPPYYYTALYSSAPPLPPRPTYDHTVSSGFYNAPSAPVDYMYEQRQKGGGGSGRIGGSVATGLSVGSVAGGLGGLVLEEGAKHEGDKVMERVDSDLNSACNSEYGDFHHRVDY